MLPPMCTYQFKIFIIVCVFIINTAKVLGDQNLKLFQEPLENGFVSANTLYNSLPASQTLISQEFVLLNKDLSSESFDSAPSVTSGNTSKTPGSTNAVSGVTSITTESNYSPTDLTNANPKDSSADPPSPTENAASYSTSADAKSLKYTLANSLTNFNSISTSPGSTETSHNISPESTDTIPSDYISSSANADIPLASNSNNGLYSKTDTVPVSPLNSFAIAALSIDEIQKHISSQISGTVAGSIMFKGIYNIRASYNVPDALADANIISEAVSTVDVLTYPTYFEAVGNAVVNFLATNHVKITPDLPLDYAAIIETNLVAIDSDNSEELYRALDLSLMQFLSSLGFDISKVANDIVYYLSYEFRALKSL